jgi:hypothetical protein
MNNIYIMGMTSSQLREIGKERKEKKERKGKRGMILPVYQLQKIAGWRK